MTPPPVASLGVERVSATAAATGSQLSSARTTPRARALDRATAVTRLLECAWRVGRGGELLLRLELPVDHGARTIGELSYSPACVADTHPTIGTREALVPNTRHRWQVEARKIGEGEYELLLSETDAPNVSRVEATLATMLRGNAHALDVAAAASASMLVLTSLPSAIGLGGGTYVLHRALFATTA